MKAASGTRTEEEDQVDIIYDIMAVVGSGVFILAAAFVLAAAAMTRSDYAGPMAFLSLALAAFGAAVAGVFYDL